MRNQITIIFLLMLTVGTYGQQAFFKLDSLAGLDSRPKIGLALSGGAAHGLSHIGVIQYLDEIGIDVDYITGTSMGAIIGALYAMGYDGKKIEELAKRLDWDALLNNKIPLNGVAAVERIYHDKYPLNFEIKDNSILLPQGFLNTNNLELELAKMFAPASGIEDFSDLPRAFRCFGVDIETAEIVTLKDGRLPKALRASMAIPSVFAPKYYQGKHLVDGGLMRNFPVTDNIDMGSDIVIGSYVGREKADISSLLTLVDILTESAFLMSIVDSKMQKEMTDILLLPDVKSLGVFDFEDYEIFIRRGYEAAKSNEEEFLALAKLLQAYPREATVALDDPGFVFIDSIRINDMPSQDQELIIDKLALKERAYVTFDHIEAGIARVTSTLNFESVSYDVHKQGAHNTLHVEAVPREEQRLGINLNHYSPTNSSLIVNGQIRNFMFRLSNLRASLRLSENPAIGGEYFVRAGVKNKNWVLGGRIEAQRYDMIYESFARQRKNGFTWEGHATSYFTYEFSNRASIRAELDLKRFDFRNEILNEHDVKRFVETGSRVGLSFTIDDRDSRVMTHKGLYTYGSVGYGFGVHNEVRFTDSAAMEFVTVPLGEKFFEGEFFLSKTVPLSDRVWWTFMGDVYYKSSPSILDHYAIGGTTIEGRRNLPFIGFREQELRTNQHLYARTDVRVGIFKNVSVAIVGNILIGESEVFRFTDKNRDTRFTAYGIGFEVGLMLPIGPVLFDIGYSSEAKNVKTDLSIGWKHFF